jgi:hypothetical protein
MRISMFEDEAENGADTMSVESSEVFGEPSIIMGPPPSDNED